MSHIWRVSHKTGPLKILEFGMLLGAIEKLVKEEWDITKLSVKLDFFDQVPRITLANSRTPPSGSRDVFDQAIDGTLFGVSGLYVSTPGGVRLPKQEFDRATFIRVRMRPKERFASDGEVIIDFWTAKPEIALVYFSFDKFIFLQRRAANAYLNEFLWEPIKEMSCKTGTER